MPAITVKPAQRVLKVFFLVDDSGSMSGPKINIINQTISEIIPSLKEEAGKREEVNFQIGCIKFGESADWYIPMTDLNNFSWHFLRAMGGATATGPAIELLCDALEVENMPKRGYPPVCILLSDGCANVGDYDASIRRLNKLSWGKKAVRVAIALGNENDYDESELLKFHNLQSENGPVGLLKAHNPAELIAYIKYASVELSQAVSSRVSEGNGTPYGNVIVPTPPTPTGNSDVF